VQLFAYICAQKKKNMDKSKLLYNPNKERDNSIDRVAGLFALYMILGHMMNWSTHYNDARLMMEHFMHFFMAWFFFKSGMFFKQKDTKEVALGCWYKLLVPFVVFSVIGIILQCIKWQMLGGEYATFNYAWTFECKRIFLYGSFEGANPLWFLLSLSITKVAYNWLKSKNIPTIGIMVFSFFFIMANWYLKLEVGKDSPAMPLLSFPRYFYNCMVGIFFFGLGHLMKEKQYKWYVWVPSLVIYVLIAIFHESRISFMHNVPSAGCDMFLYYISAACGCFAVNALFKGITKLTTKLTKKSILAYFGRNSIAVYTLHWPIMMIVWMIFVQSNIFLNPDLPEVKPILRTPEVQAELWKEVILYSAFCLTLIPILNKLILKSKLHWILGK